MHTAAQGIFHFVERLPCSIISLYGDTMIRNVFSMCMIPILKKRIIDEIHFLSEISSLNMIDCSDIGVLADEDCIEILL